jgi:hypothetical protein
MQAINIRGKPIRTKISDRLRSIGPPSIGINDYHLHSYYPWPKLFYPPKGQDVILLFLVI